MPLDTETSNCIILFHIVMHYPFADSLPGWLPRTRVIAVADLLLFGPFPD